MSSSLRITLPAFDSIVDQAEFRLTEKEKNYYRILPGEGLEILDDEGGPVLVFDGGQDVGRLADAIYALGRQRFEAGVEAGRAVLALEIRRLLGIQGAQP